MDGQMVVDVVSGIVLGSRNRQVELRLIKSVDTIERLAFVNAIADLLEDPDPRPGIDRGGCFVMAGCALTGGATSCSIAPCGY